MLVMMQKILQVKYEEAAAHDTEADEPTRAAQKVQHLVCDKPIGVHHLSHGEQPQAERRC